VSGSEDAEGAEGPEGTSEPGDAGDAEDAEDEGAAQGDAEESEAAAEAEDAEEAAVGAKAGETGEAGEAEEASRADARDADAKGSDTKGSDTKGSDAEAASIDARGASAASGDRDEADAAGDARLRAAVASWVDSADEEKGAEGTKADADDAADTEAEDSTETGAVTEPEAADGEDAPQGPLARDDESRTGGAGGNEKADGEAADVAQPPQGSARDDESRTGGAGGNEKADGEAKAAPVDQPTTVFKAVRPAKPPVDQPTTMLKLDGATKDPQEKTPESDAERTSKFVALKPLDDPETRKPKPTAPAAPAAPAVAPAASAAPAAPADATTPVPQVGPERTTQQPLPPKPPLDLLAELTNTPPPPETPLRTLVRRVKIWTPLVVLLAIIFAIVQAVRPLPTPTLALTAKDSYTFDGSRVNLPWPSEGQGWMDVNGIGTMGNFGKQTPVAIGSVAKTMTAYIVLKDHPLKPGQEGPKIEVDPTAEKEGGYDKDGESTLNTVKAGDKLTEKQALSAIMIPSANNIARLLARWDAGSEAAFVKKMNDTAKKLGMTGTSYTDPSGLKETTVSTAEDQVKLGNEVVKIPALMAITKLPGWTDPSGKFWRNYNALVPYNNALGIKTGTTTAAGGNLLFAATKLVGGETVTVVGAILGQHKAPIIDTVNEVSKTAMLAAQDAMTSAKILKKGDVVGYVDDQLGGHTPVVVTKDVTAVGWAGLKVKLSFASDDVPHSAKAGTKVGTLTVGDGIGGAVRVPVALQKDLTEPGFTNKLTRLG
ncbi:D-alanyl-D-alanine carboxypeptidase, partial [Streptomyces sp. NPDC005202]|uniref:D-alanyl-D-alanine carboxypeptidase n=1 Tax=Streptomyces sp. NPDC005202 TaxID=3157021 RepID=UPI00339E9832